MVTGSAGGVSRVVSDDAVVVVAGDVVAASWFVVGMGQWDAYD